MSSTVIDPQVPAPLTEKLTALDRCDRCGAQAYTRFSMKGMELLFCSHHTREHEPKLLADGAILVVDDRHLLAPTNRQQGASY